MRTKTQQPQNWLLWKKKTKTKQNQLNTHKTHNTEEQNLLLIGPSRIKLFPNAKCRGRAPQRADEVHSISYRMPPSSSPVCSPPAQVPYWPQECPSVSGPTPSPFLREKDNACGVTDRRHTRPTSQGRPLLFSPITQNTGAPL